MKFLNSQRHKLSFLLICLAGLLSTCSQAGAREWKDQSGHYRFEADLIARNGSTVILETAAKKLLSVKIDKLSKTDQEHLASLADEHLEKTSESQTWHLRGGLKIQGAVVEYGRRKVVVQRRRGKVYVNDKRFDNLPEFYQQLIPKVISEQEKSDDPTKDLKKWVLRQHGRERSYMVDGVMVEFENGDLYGVPFFMFADEDKTLLKPGWESWLAADEDHKRQEAHELELQARAKANREEALRERQVQQLQLQMEAYEAGLFDLWEVEIIPRNGNGPWRHVVVPARDSATASSAALRENPGYNVSAIARVNRD